MFVLDDYRYQLRRRNFVGRFIERVWWPLECWGFRDWRYIDERRLVIDNGRNVLYSSRCIGHGRAR